MTSEPKPGNSNEEEIQRQQMLEALGGAVANEDYEFSTQIAGQQGFLRPFEIAEYMDVKRRSLEDAVEQTRWKDALLSFLETLEGVEFPDDEIQVINNIISSLEFEEITSNQEIAEIDEKDEDSDENNEYDEEADDDNWEDDNFAVPLDDKTIEQIRNNIVFQRAEAYATGKILNRVDLDKALRQIDDNVEGDLADKMYAVLDWYIFLRAEAYATGRILNRVDLEKAVETINEYNSSDEAERRMRSALDKHVYDRAKAYAEGKVLNRVELEKAKLIIETFASTVGRQEAMLRRLGFK